MEHLKKTLTLFDVFSIASGAMISSGLFILPSIAYFKIGPAVFLSYLVAGLLMIPTIFSKSELATAMPKSGGTYFFIGRTMGNALGTISGISAWFSLAFKSSFALLGIGAFTQLIFPEMSLMQIKLVAISFCLFFTFMNIVSTKHSGIIQIFLVIALIGILLIYNFKGFVFLLKDFPHIDLHNFSPFIKGNLFTVFKTSGLLFISFGGLTKIASISEEIKNPKRNIPLGMFSSFIIITILYVLTVFVTVGVLGKNLILSDGTPSLTPISDSALLILGKPGMIILSIAALFAFISTANAGIMSASRSPMAMSRDAMLPPIFSKISKRFKTPVFSILMTSLFMITVILFLNLEFLVKTASTLMILLFIWVNISVIIMRESKLINYKPSFKSPFYPWIQIFAVVVYVFLIIEMGTIPILLTLSFILLSLFWYLIYAKKSSTNADYALVHMISSITDKQLKNNSLDNELKEIVRYRDNIEKDEFDAVIEKSPIIDLNVHLHKEELFKKIATMISKRLELSDKLLLEKITMREDEGSTVLTNDIAIPHIIIEGKKNFDIILIRNTKGVYYSDENPNVKAIFMIIGTKDKRSLHLKSLAAIAQIIQEKKFITRWLTANSKEQLKDIILLGRRMR